MKSTDFQELIWQKGSELYRPMPWRDDVRPYYILVSELMLQQTQVDRVIPKFQIFIDRFPDTGTLAQASLADVLTIWSGLGYNRRAKYLHEAAKRIEENHAGVFPGCFSDLLALPGVGKNTAGAIMNYAFNHPWPFVETNVRTVYFYHFFPGQGAVSDGELLPLVAATIDHEHPREFYWALMDYGSWLKRRGVGNNSQSAHYKKQSPLKGSVREMRGQIIRALTGGGMSIAGLEHAVDADGRFVPALDALLREGLVTVTDGQYYLTK